MDSIVVAVRYVIGIIVIYKICDRVIRIPRLKTSYRRNIVITGCDSGFGNMFVKRMDRRGYRVFATCLTEDGRSKLNAETSSRVIPLLMNVADENSIKNAVEFVTSQLLQNEGVWALVNNAGINGRSGPAEWLEASDYQEVFNVNIFGMINACKHFIPLIRICRGRIVNTTSIVGRIAFPAAAPYVASKFAVEGYSDTLRREMTAFGISVHIVEPGLFKTECTNVEKFMKLLSDTWTRTPEELRKTYGGEEFYNRATKIYLMSSNFCSLNLQPVINSYEHAVTARFPRTRYMPGWTAWLALWPMIYLPEWVTDKLFKLP